MPLWVIAALLLGAIGAFLLYAGARNQRLTIAGGRHPALLKAGALLLVLSLALLWQWFGPATAVFTWMTVAMLVWSVAPLTIVWWRRPRGNAE